MHSKYAETVFKAVLMNKSIKPGDLVMSSGSETKNFHQIKKKFFFHFFQS